MSIHWNTAFTNLVRQTNAGWWGNWSLDPNITPGAVGYIDVASSSFNYLTDLPNAQGTPTTVSQEWSTESSNVHRTESDVTFSGEYHDPTSGNEVTTGLQTTWTFSSANAMASNATVVAHSALSDYGTVLNANFEWLKQKALSVGYSTGTGINQGFGVVTGVQFCAGGVNIASLAADSTFSLTGSVDGIQAMTGGGSGSASLAGSYKEANETGAVERHLWPSTSNTAASGNVAITYTFTSFDQHLIMPNWIMPIDDFSVTFDNSHGGTYIAHCTLSYVYDDQTIYLEKTVPGGQSKTLDGIPVGAIKMLIAIDFEAGDNFFFSAVQPLTKFPTGHRTFDLGGVWPWGASVSVRGNPPWT